MNSNNPVMRSRNGARAARRDPTRAPFEVPDRSAPRRRIRLRRPVYGHAVGELGGRDDDLILFGKLKLPIDRSKITSVRLNLFRKVAQAESGGGGGRELDILITTGVAIFLVEAKWRPESR